MGFLRGRLCGAMSILMAVGARYADGGAIVIEVRALALFECLGGWIDDAHACEVFLRLTMRQYIDEAKKIAADSPGCCHDGR